MRKMKTKKIISIITIAIMVITMGIVQVASLGSTRAESDPSITFTVDELKYTVTSTNPAEVAVAGLVDGSSATDITIPNAVTNDNVTYSVTSIGREAFDWSVIQGIAIPHSVKTIGERAFYRCEKLAVVTIENTDAMPSKLETIGNAAFIGSIIQEIVIPQSVTSIGDYAFNACEKLAVVTIENTKAPSKLKTIGAEAFAGSGIQGIVIPQGVTSIGYRAFYLCADLAKVEIENTDGAKSQLATIGEYAFFQSGIQGIVIPQSVTSIGNRAFALCADLAKVEIKNPEAQSKLETIGEYAFYKSGIRSIIIPQSVTSIGAHAFGECKQLAKVTIENKDGAQSKLETIGDYAFFQSAIQEIIIPQSVETVGKCAFWKCVDLTSVTITSTDKMSSKLETVDNHAFRATGLTSITIPQSVVTVGEYAFYQCASLTSVEIKNTVAKPSKLETIGVGAFSNSGITSIVIPQSVETIGKYAFYFCSDLGKVEIANTEAWASKLTTIQDQAFQESGLKSIIIPQSVEKIDPYAFNACPNLGMIVFSGATVPTFGEALFSGAGKDISAYVPFAQKEAYKAALTTDAVLEDYEHALTVSGYEELVLPDETLDDAEINEADYSQSVAATGGIEGGVVTYEITTGAGDLPTGLTLNTDGTITGTPTKVGTATFTVTATVSNALAELEYSDTQEYTINVVDKIPPVLSVENKEVTIELNGNIIEEDFLKLVGVTTTDNSDADVTTRTNNAGVSITTNFASVKQNVLGKTIVTITATDASGNFSTATITVNVTDTTPEPTTAPTTEEPTTVTEEPTTGAGTDVATGDTFVTPLFFVVALFGAVGILISRKRKEELQG